MSADFSEFLRIALEWAINEFFIVIPIDTALAEDRIAGVTFIRFKQYREAYSADEEIFFILKFFVNHSLLCLKCFLFFLIKCFIVILEFINPVLGTINHVSRAEFLLIVFCFIFEKK